LKYRKASAADRPAIHAILKSSFNRIYAYYAEKSFTSLSKTIVSTDKSGVTGIINWRNFRVGDQKICYLYWLAVRPDCRKMGLGKELFRRAMAKGTNCTMTAAATQKRNRPARTILQQEGFSVMSRKDLKARFGAGARHLAAQMNLVPWEDLFVRDCRENKSS
jgi:N-acetylglutamate synthase-like GNAT family acetyltransferase